jgi:dipeptidase E
MRSKNPQLPVIALREGDWLRVSGSSIELRGAHAAVWFHGEKAPARIQPGTPTPSGDSL